MASGGLSYSGIVGYGKVTLPSVESWGTNMNILKDPPKSIYTRKIDKVGETSSITEMIDESTNRTCEAISVYPRGQNPMVSVQYSGKSSGLPSGSTSTNFGGCTIPSASLPYKIMNAGAFRPPMEYGRQERLLPLSRLPRLNTSVMTQPGYVNFQKKHTPVYSSENNRCIRPIKMRPSIRPTATYSVENISEGHGGLQVSLNPILLTSASSGMGTRDIAPTADRPVKVSEVLEDPISAYAQALPTSSVGCPSGQNTVDTGRFVNENSLIGSIDGITAMPRGLDGVMTMNADPFIQDVISTEAVSNPCGINETFTSVVDAKPFTQEHLAGEILPSFGQERNIHRNACYTDPYTQDIKEISVFANPNDSRELWVHTVDSSPFIQDTLHSDVQAPCSISVETRSHTFDSSPFTQELETVIVPGVVSNHYRGNSLDQLRGLTNIQTQDTTIVDYTTPALRNDPVLMRYDLPTTERNMPVYELHSGLRDSRIEKHVPHEHQRTLVENLPPIEYVPDPKKPTGLVSNNAIEYNSLPDILQKESFVGEPRRPSLHRMIPDYTLKYSKSGQNRQAVHAGVAGRWG